jgi:hypothetical protein
MIIEYFLKGFSFVRRMCEVFQTSSTAKHSKNQQLSERKVCQMQEILFSLAIQNSVEFVYRVYQNQNAFRKRMASPRP